MKNDILWKLEETNYFYNEMIKNMCCPQKFEFNYDAFNSSGRSILLYIKTSIGKDGIDWFNNLYNTKKLLKFFKEQRDNLIHEKRVGMKRNIEINVQENISLSLGMSCQVIEVDADGNESDGNNNFSDNLQSELVSQLAKDKMPTNTTSIDYTYKFVDWKGSEDAVELACDYLTELTEVIEEGSNRGYF